MDTGKYRVRALLTVQRALSGLTSRRLYAAIAVSPAGRSGCAHCSSVDLARWIDYYGLAVAYKKMA